MLLSLQNKAAASRGIVIKIRLQLMLYRLIIIDIGNSD